MLTFKRLRPSFIKADFSPIEDFLERKTLNIYNKKALEAPQFLRTTASLFVNIREPK